MILINIFGISIFLIILVQSNVSAYQSFVHKNHAVRKQSNQYCKATNISTRYKRSLRNLSGMIAGQRFSSFRKRRSLNEIEENMTECFESEKKWCNNRSKYPTTNGVCNNLNHPSWGMRTSATLRLITPRYDDGKCSVHTLSGTKEPLPSSLKTSDTITNLNRLPMMKNVTTFFTIFAQIIADDVVSSMVKSKNRESCCSSIKLLIDDDPSCSCMETKIPQYISNCTKMARSETTFNEGCKEFPVYQLSNTTSYLDASFLYPPDVDDLAAVRSYRNGKLKIAMDDQRRPFIRTYNDYTNVTHTTDRSLVHANTGTKTLQTMFIRLHNFLCDMLSWINPTWDDLLLYLESRRFLIAMYQHIVYFEFVPIVIGYDYATKYDLMPSINRLQETYDHKINPKTVNSFATAAFRYFHTLIPASLSLVDRRYKITKNVSFVGTAEDIDITQHDWYDSVIRGSTTVSLMDQDQLDFRQRHLLHAMDTERGRDHGLASYNDYREACGLRRFHHFKQLHSVMYPENVKHLTELYDDVDEIELYVAGMLEKPAKDAIVGPTFQCIIAEAFYRYKYGDRYFYEHKNVFGQFTKEQMLEIKKATASLLICISSDSIMKAQTNAFYLPSTENPFVPCELILRPDYSLWQEIASSCAKKKLKWF